MLPSSSVQISGVITIDSGDNKTIISLLPLKNSKSCVYEIRNKFLLERVYIGQTRNFEKRHKEHFRLIIEGKHINKLLQEDWNNFKTQNTDEWIHPSEIFQVSKIICCRISELTFYENLLIKTLNPYYNLHK
jgi:hypothetical protein